MQKDIPKWLQYYHKQIDIRNQSQSTAFKDLIKNYSDVMSRCMTLEREKHTPIVSPYFFSKLWNRKSPQESELTEKIRTLESELTGTYKEHKESTMQILELTRSLKESEMQRKSLENQVQAMKEYNDHNANIISQKVFLFEDINK